MCPLNEERPLNAVGTVITDHYSGSSRRQTFYLHAFAWLGDDKTTEKRKSAL